MTPMTTRLRELLARERPLVMPFAYDTFSALLIAEAGFSACALSGSGLSASLLGLPDVGMLTRDEVVGAARRITAVSPIPLVVDADTGFGGVTAAVRTLQDLEAAGAAGMIIEDQQAPKRCGHLAGISLIPQDAMVAKLRVLAQARRDPDFLLIGRTDAIGAGPGGGGLDPGFEDAVRRASAYLAAGADVVFVSALRSAEQMQAVLARVPGPVLVVLTEGGKSPFVSNAQLGAWGAGIVGYAGTALSGAAWGALSALRELRQEGGSRHGHPQHLPMPERNRILRLEDWAALDDAGQGGTS